MNLLDRSRAANDLAVASRPSTCMALVPLRGDAKRAPAPVRPRARVLPHQVCYAVGYAALGAFLVAALLGPYLGGAAPAIYVPAALLLAITGIGSLVFTIIQRDEPAVRRMLAAIAGLAAMIALHGPISHLGHHVHASSRVAGAQPVVDKVLRVPGITSLELGHSDWMDLNGYAGMRGDGAGFVGPPARRVRVPTLAALLRQEGVSAADLQRVEEAMRAAGVSEVAVTPEYVALTWDHPGGASLLYSRRGTVPVSGTYVLDLYIRNMRPLGGGWYLNR